MIAKTLVERARHGDREAFGALAAEVIDRTSRAVVLPAGVGCMAELVRVCS